MTDGRTPPTLDYADPRFRRTDAAPVAFVFGLVFLAPAFLMRGGLHGELNPIVLLIWFLIGAAATRFAFASWRQRRWTGIGVQLGRVAIGLTVVGWLLGVATIFGPVNDPHALDVRLQSRCRANLSSVGQAVLLYTYEHGGRYPDRPDELLSIGLSVGALVCPSTDDTPAASTQPADVADAIASGGHLSYVYVGKGLTTATTRPGQVVLYEPAHNHTRDHPGIHVLYVDGNVKYLEGDAAEALLDSMRSGENPPGTPARP